MNEPRLTLKVAVYIILQRGNKILFLRRINTGWSDGLFCLPSGHIDPHEMPTSAAVRETFEETGIKVSQKDLKFVHVSFRKDEYVDFFFLANSWTGEPKITEPEKSDTFAWLDPKKAEQKIVPSVYQVIQCIKKNLQYSQTDLLN